MAMSNEADILIVSDSSERFTPEIRTKFRHWQVYACSNPFGLTGRRFRRAYVTAAAMEHGNWHRVLGTIGDRGEVVHIDDYEAPTVDAQDYEDAELLRQLRRSRYAQDWV